MGGAVSIAVIDNTTTARVGTGSSLDLTGGLSVTATHHGSSNTTADGKALGEKAGIGAAIALAFVLAWG